MENDVQALKVLKNLVHGEANAKALHDQKLDFSPLINDNVKFTS